MSNRTKAYRRHQNNRVINKRKNIVKRWNKGIESYVNITPVVEGKYRKYNLACSCGMCDINHPFKCKKGVLSDKELHRIKNLDDDMIEEVN